MVINFGYQSVPKNFDTDEKKRKIHLRNPNMRDASTSHLHIPDTIEYRPPEQDSEYNHRQLRKNIFIGLLPIPILLAGGYFVALRGAEKTFFVDSILKSKKYFRPIIQELEGKISKITLKTKDKVNLNCWDINPNGFDKYVIVCHGNSQNINDCQEIYGKINQKGYGVLAFEYRGYAHNPGRTTEQGLYKDAEAAFEYIKGKGIDNKKIGVFGYSLGGAIATDLASKHDLGFIILMSTFTNAKDLCRSGVNYLDLKLPPKIKKAIDKIPNAFIPIGSSYSSDQKIAKIKSPIVFIHSIDDNAIPIKHSQKLADNAKASSKKHFITLSSGSHWLDETKFNAVSDAIDKIFISS